MKEKDMKTNVPMWTFYYHKGPAPKYGTVEARDEVTAMKVATVWCQKNGARPPASVQPFILANESILTQVVAETDEGLPGPVVATTGVNAG